MTGIIAKVSARHVEVGDLGPGDWWIAHEFAERPPDEWTVWDWGCVRCFMHLSAAALTTSAADDYGHQEIVLDCGIKMEGMTLAETWRLAAEWREAAGL